MAPEKGQKTPGGSSKASKAGNTILFRAALLVEFSFQRKIHTKPGQCVSACCTWKWHLLIQSLVCTATSSRNQLWKNVPVESLGASARDPLLSKALEPLAEVELEGMESNVAGLSWGKEMDDILPICDMEEDLTDFAVSITIYSDTC